MGKPIISNKGGIFNYGNSHLNGGIPIVVSDTMQNIEVEKGEPLIPKEALQSEKVKVREGTNLEILDEINKEVGAKGMSQPAKVVESGDVIICKRSAHDKKKRTYKGTNKQIAHEINTGGGCNPILNKGNKHKQGGKVAQLSDFQIIKNLSGEHKETYLFAHELSKCRIVDIPKCQKKILEYWNKNLKQHFEQEEQEYYNKRNDTESINFLKDHDRFRRLITQIDKAPKFYDIRRFSTLMQNHIIAEERYFASDSHKPILKDGGEIPKLVYIVKTEGGYYYIMGIDERGWYGEVMDGDRRLYVVKDMVRRWGLKVVTAKEFNDFYNPKVRQGEHSRNYLVTNKTKHKMADGGGVKADINELNNEGLNKALLSFREDFNAHLANYLQVGKENYVISDKENTIVFFRDKSLGDFTSAEKIKIGEWINPYFDMSKKPLIAEYLNGYAIDGNRIKVAIVENQMYKNGGFAGEIKYRWRYTYKGEIKSNTSKFMHYEEAISFINDNGKSFKEATLYDKSKNKLVAIYSDDKLNVFKDGGGVDEEARSLGIKIAEIDNWFYNGGKGLGGRSQDEWDKKGAEVEGLRANLYKLVGENYNRFIPTETKIDTYPSEAIRNSPSSKFRYMYPNVRGGVWTKEKIRKALKTNSGKSFGRYSINNLIAEFENWREFKEHIYYHGTGGGVGGSLRPSILMSEREAERSGGGGYGDRYWAISLSKSKNKASNFTSQSTYGTVYSVILKKGARVIEMPEINDSNELEDIIEKLWADGVDAIKIGDWSNDSSEMELSVLNPNAIFKYEQSEGFAVYGKKRFSELTDDEIEYIYEQSKENVKKMKEIKAKYPIPIDFSKTTREERMNQREAREMAFREEIKPFKFANGGGVSGKNIYDNAKVDNWNQIPKEWKVVKRVSPVKYELSPTNDGFAKIFDKISGTDELRPIMSGAYFTKDSVSITDAHKLFYIYEQTKFDGVYNFSKKIKEFKQGEKIDGKYPNVEAVTITKSSLKNNVFEIDVIKLKTYCMAIIEGEYTNMHTYQIAFKGDGFAVGFRGSFLIEMLNVWMMLGYTKLYYFQPLPNRGAFFCPNKEALEYGDLYGNVSYSLLMPLMLNGQVLNGQELGAKDMDFEHECNVYFDLTKNEIINKDGSIARFDDGLTSYGNPFFSDKELSIYKKVTKSTLMPIIDSTIRVKGGVAMVSNLDLNITKNKVNIPDGVYLIVNGSLRLSDMPLDDFPMLPKIENVITEGDYKFDELLTKFGYAINNIGNDDLRPIMKSINLVDEFIEATNAHTLYRDKLAMHPKGINVSITNPREIHDVLSLSGIKSTYISVKTANLEHDLPKNFMFKFAEYTIIGRTSGDRFPKVRGVIPLEFKKSIRVNTNELKSIASKIKANVNLGFNFKDGEIVLHSYKIEHDGIKERNEIGKIKATFAEKITSSAIISEYIMPVVSHLGGFDITFNAKLLTNALNSIEETSELVLAYSETNRIFGVVGVGVEKKKIKEVVKEKVPEISIPYTLGDLQTAIEGLDAYVETLEEGTERQDVIDAVEGMKIMLGDDLSEEEDDEPKAQEINEPKGM